MLFTVCIVFRTTSKFVCINHGSYHISGMNKLNSVGVVIVLYLFLFSDFDFKREEFSVQFSFNIFDFSCTAIITRYMYGLGLMLCNPHTVCELIISVD